MFLKHLETGGTSDWEKYILSFALRQGFLNLHKATINVLEAKLPKHSKW